MLWPNDTIRDPESTMRGDQFNFGGATFASSGGEKQYPRYTRRLADISSCRLLELLPQVLSSRTKACR